MKNSVLYHLEDLDLEEMTDEEAGAVFKAICKYAATGEKTEFNDRFLRAQFKRLVNRHDADEAAYEEKCTQNSINGAKGGRPKKPNGFDENRTVSEKTERFSEKAKKADKDMDMDKDKDLDMDKKESIEAEKRPTHSEPRKKYGEFHHVRLTDAEYGKLVSDFGEYQTDQAIKKVDEYCERTGKTYKNYNLTLRKWGYDGIGPPDENQAMREDIAKLIEAKWA